MSESIIKIPTLKNEKFGKVKVSIVGGLTAESDEITLEIKNCSPKRITYDGSFTLEMFKETWEKVNAGETYNECSYTLKGFSSVNETLKLGKALDCGKYRLTKEVGGKEHEIIFVISDFLEIKDILEWFNLSANRIKTKAVKVISNFSDLQYNKDFTETDFLSEMVDDLAEVIFMKDKRSVNYKDDDIIEHYPIFGEKYDFLFGF